MERVFSVVLMVCFFSLKGYAHRGKLDRVIEVLLENNRLTVEVLQIIYTYDRDYDIIRNSMDIDRNGKITKKEAQSTGREIALRNLLHLSVKLNGEIVRLGLAKIEVQEYPDKINSARTTKIWQKFVGEVKLNQCKDFYLKDSSNFHRAVFRFREISRCAIFQSGKIIDGREGIIKVFHGRLKNAFIKLRGKKK